MSVTRRIFLQSTALATVPAVARRATASVVTISWDRPRAAPGDVVRVIVRVPAGTSQPLQAVVVTLHPPTGPPTRHELRLTEGRAELELPLPRPDEAGVQMWRAETAGAVARLEVIANRFVFGL